MFIVLFLQWKRGRTGGGEKEYGKVGRRGRRKSMGKGGKWGGGVEMDGGRGKEVEEGVRRQMEGGKRDMRMGEGVWGRGKEGEEEGERR